jgi:hypothetical protein
VGTMRARWESVEHTGVCSVVCDSATQAVRRKRWRCC